MKKLGLIFTFFVCFHILVLSQEYVEDESDSLFNSGYASIFVIQSKFAGGPMTYLGAQGAVLIKDKLVIGAFGMRKTGQLYAVKGEYSGKRMGFGLGGIVTGYGFAPNSRINPTLMAMFGIGGISVSTSEGYSIKKAFDRLYGISPSVSFEFRITHYIRFALGASWMQFFEVSFDGYSYKDLNYPGVCAGIKIVTK